MTARAARPAALALLAAVLLSGCDGPAADKPAAGRFPLRTDPIVLAAPPQPPTAPPGTDLDKYLADLPARGAAVLDPKTLPGDQRAKLSAVLADLFGPPSEPKLLAGGSALAGIAHDPGTLTDGMIAFRGRCAPCHGFTGDGRGPSGPFLFPHPRDYRSGKFKSATGAGVSTGRPKPDDLRRVLRRGVPGTAMPSFDSASLTDADLDKLLAAVFYLSVRGETELTLMTALADPDEAPNDLAKAGREASRSVMAKWVAAQADVPDVPSVPPRPDVPTPEYHESIRRGLKLFTTAGCIACHERYGRADVYRYDAWGLPGRVRNLTEPDRRWTRDAADVALRVRHGIATANMPANPTLSATDLADLAAFARELPYPDRLPPDVKGATHP